MRQSTNQRYQLCVLVTLVAGTVIPTTAAAHKPDRETQPAHQRIDVIGPLGNRFPPSYRRVYNRPTYLGGKVAYLIAPSSQEAMAWHKAEHIGAYKNHLPRIENAYFYPKPWEAMRIGQRVSVLEPAKQAARPLNYDSTFEDDGMISPVISDPIPSQVETLETIDLPNNKLGVESGKK